MSGRAGRTGDQGEVMIQTFDPKNPVFEHLKKHDYQALYQQQIEERRLFGFPPFHRMIMLTIKHRDSARLLAGSEMLHKQLTQVFGKRVSGVIIPSIARVQNMHVRQIRIMIEVGANIAHAKELIQQQIASIHQCPKSKGCTIFADVDPM